MFLPLMMIHNKLFLDVEYTIEILDSKDNLIVEFDAYSPDEKLKTLIVPSQTTNFLGETAENGSLLASNQSPLTVEGTCVLGRRTC